VDLPGEHVQVEIMKDRFASDGQPDVDKIQHGDHRPSALLVTFASISMI